MDNNSKVYKIKKPVINMDIKKALEEYGLNKKRNRDLSNPSSAWKCKLAKNNKKS